MASSIWCYTPTQKFTRFYFLVNEGDRPQDYPQDKLWEIIKRQVLFIEPDLGDFYWDSQEEQDEYQREWFVDWENPKNWSEAGTVAVDNHY